MNSLQSSTAPPPGTADPQPPPWLMYGAQPWMFPYGMEWPLRYWSTPRPPLPPPIKATFDGIPEKLAFFLNQAWSYSIRHGIKYAEDGPCVNVIMANPEGEVLEWVTTLHDEGTAELGDLVAFQGELRAQFSEPCRPDKPRPKSTT